MLQAISFVDDIGLVVECSELGEGARQLERIASDAIRWGSDNKVEFEVSKTEVLVFSKRRKILRSAKDAAIRIGEQTLKPLLDFVTDKVDRHTIRKRRSS